MNNIYYKDSYKYQTTQEYSDNIIVKPFEDIKTEYINLDSNGKITIKKGYAWDGASGPVIDRKSNMRGSLVHDALYQLIRTGHLGMEFRDLCDRCFRNICIYDGTSVFVANIYYQALRLFGKKAASPSNIKKEHRSP